MAKLKNNLNTQSVLSMRGSGYYSERTAGAKIAIDTTQPLMEKALREIPKSDKLRFADFGSADGGTSQEMWCNLIRKLRANNDDREIEIIYTDLASNDFSTLFKTMQGMQGNTDIAFQNKFSNIFVHGCGTGFHQKLMASESLSLGFSATAMHYVSQKPCQIKNHVHMVGANESEKNYFKRQAHIDWESILLSRSKELVSGGRFICLNFGIDEQGRHLGNTGGHSMFDKFTSHWKKMRERKEITDIEFEAATFAQHYRTVDEFCQPFEDHSSSVYTSGLRLISCSTKLTKCPYRSEYEKNKEKISSKEFAENLIPTMRSWSETVFRTALINRKENEIDSIVNNFYSSYQQEISDNPNGHAMDYVHIIMEIEKI